MAKDQRKRLYQQVADRLAEDIAAGRYQIGDRLPSERDLAVSLGVSRPTLREAVIALELDGLVDVRTGSGVYVVATAPNAAAAAPRASEMGHFEVLEARRIIEPEAAALAARGITAQELRELHALVAEMETQNDRGDVVMSEDADRRFHISIARASQNSAVAAVVEMLWDARTHSNQSQRVLEKVRAVGVKPRINEHEAVLDALARRDSEAARAAMAEHLDQVLDVMLETQEHEAIERARADIAAKRQRYRVRG
ncbi:MAG: FadR/GntR family transcriptional regulator [Hyphomonadaceae bacterium]|nr:FadR/GntR family transcriptional regulator [Hyphomonadaceae bacterium]